jgi:hypothetical protein
LLVTFDSLANPNRALTGQYPIGVLDWGSSSWYLSGPYDLLTTNSVSFSGQNVTSATVVLVIPSLFTGVEADNGGGTTTVVTLTCTPVVGPPLQHLVTMQPHQVMTIQTGWAVPCSSVTLASTNGWDTNFTNFALD